MTFCILLLLFKNKRLCNDQSPHIKNQNWYYNHQKKNPQKIKIIYLIGSKKFFPYFLSNWRFIRALSFVPASNIHSVIFKMQIIQLRGVLFSGDSTMLHQVLQNTQPCAGPAQTCGAPRKSYKKGTSRSLSQSSSLPCPLGRVLPSSSPPAALGANEKSMSRIRRHFPPLLNPQRASHSLTLT